MAVRLVRESSDVPSITNQDDTKMIRYAYGNYSGFVKDYKSELSSTVSKGNKFTIWSGRVVLQGWEVDIDSSGWSMTVVGSTGTQYYVVYLELDLSLETATIKSTYATGSVPEIPLGDDLTEHPFGVARLLLYELKVTSGNIEKASRIIPPVPYLSEKVAYLEERLEKMGFSEASVKSGGISLNAGWTDAVPSYDFLGSITGTSEPAIHVVKSGKLAVLKEIFVATHTEATKPGTTNFNINGTIAVLPDMYRPKSDISVTTVAKYLVSNPNLGRVLTSTAIACFINTAGEIRVSGSGTSSGYIIITETYPVVVELHNVGWDIL